MTVITWTQLRDAAVLGQFLRSHGPAPFNHLDEAGIEDQCHRLATGRLGCTAGLAGGEVVALATVSTFVGVRPAGTSHLRLSGHYLEEVAVHAEHRGLGLGVELLREAVRRHRGLPDYYIDCDERNTACVRMIGKAGFDLVLRYADAERGSAAQPRQSLLFRRGEGG